MAKKFPDNVESGSDFWRYGATASVTGGIGYGLHRAHPAVRAAMTSGVRDVAGEVSAELRSLGRFNVAPANRSAATGSVGEDILRNLAASSSMKTVKTDIAAATYEAALAGGRSTHTEAYGAYQQVLSQTSVHNAYEHAKQSLNKLQGDVGLLTSRIGDLGQGGFYGRTLGPLGGDLHGTMLSSGGFIGGRESVSLTGGLRQKALGIQSRLESAAAKAGGKIKWQGYYNVVDVLEGQTVTTPMLKGSIGGESLNIPLRNTGLSYSGENLTARYVTRGSFAAKGDKIKDFGTTYVDELEQVISSQKTTTGIKNAVIDTNNKIINTMRTRDAAHRSMAIWKMPEPMLTSGGRVKARMNSMEAVYSGGRMTEGMRSEVIEEALSGKGRNLFPIGSPETVAKGTFIKGNIAEELFGPIGRLMGVEDRPTQFIREEFGVTAASKQRAGKFQGAFGQHFGRLDRKIQGAGYKQLLYGGADVTSAQAYSAPQLTTFYANPNALESGPLSEIMSAEEFVVSNKASPMMEYERVVQKKVSLNKDFRTNQVLLRSLEQKPAGELVKGAPFGAGSFIGIEQGTGKEVWGTGAGGAKAEVIGAQLTGKNKATVFMRETHRLSQDEWWKVFSEDTKFMGRGANKQRMAEVARAAGVNPMDIGQDLEAVVSGKLVQRNKGALLTQQIEAISMLSSKKIEQGSLTLRKRLLAKEFMEDPSRYLKLDSLMGEGMADAEFQIQKNMVALTKKFGFKHKEMAMTFGLWDSRTLKALVDEGSLDVRQAAQIRYSPGVVGLSKMRLGDLASEGGAGNLAKFDQSGFRLLAMKDEEGKRFAAEMSTRLLGKDELSPANRMEASILNRTGMKERISQMMGMAPTDERTLRQMAEGDLLKAQGRYVNLGQKIEAFGGASQIYVPGIEEAEGLIGPKIYKGEKFPSDIAKGLENMRRVMQTGGATEEIEASALALRRSIVQQTEQQASATGRVAGSRYLTGIRQTAAETAKSNASVGISKGSATSMFDDLISRAATHDQKLYLSDQKRKLIDESQQLIGGMWRHPTTGPESFQFINYHVDHNLSDKMVSVPRQMGKFALEGMDAKDVDISSMVGMKGDFDNDKFSIAAISDRDTVNRLKNKMSHGAQGDYTKYLFNHYAMKDMIDGRKGTVKNLVDLSRQEALEVGARNLTAAKIATPEVNTALQKLKLGLQYSAPKEYRPMAELFWHLEEAAISGKHGAQQSSLYQNIAHAVRSKDTATMEGVIKQLMGEQSLEVSGKITSPTGDLVSQTMKYSPKRWAEQAIQSASVVGEDVEAAYRSARAVKGSVSGNFYDLVESSFKRRTGSLDVAQSVMHSKTYGMPGFTETTNRVLRQASAKSRSILGGLQKAKGPALIGAAIAGGLMLAAPSISGAINAPMEGVAGGRNLSHNDLGPPAGAGMSVPPPRIMSSPKAYDMSGIKMSSRAKIRMTMPDANSASNNFMKHAGTLASGGNVRIHTTDDRSALSPHRLANKIHERL